MSQKIKDASIPTIPFKARFSRWFGRNLLRIYMIFGFTYLFIPVAYTFAFSFNDSGKSNGRSSSNLLIFLPMATPEIVLGASLLSLFLVFKINPGFWPTVIAHVVFCVSFVVVTVKARIASLDPRLEQAAMDLYANELETFRKVTLPLVAPGIAGAALLAFSLSFDDFIITNFNSGTLITFPKFVYVSAARGIPAQANVIGSAMFFLALAIVIAGQLVKRKKNR